MPEPATQPSEPRVFDFTGGPHVGHEVSLAQLRARYGREPNRDRALLVAPGVEVQMMHHGDLGVRIAVWADSAAPPAAGTVAPSLADALRASLVEARAGHARLCESGCGCRYGTDDADARACGCDGPCTGGAPIIDLECRDGKHSSCGNSGPCECTCHLPGHDDTSGGAR